MEISGIIIASILGFVFGAVFGGLMATRFTSDQRKTRELEKHLHEKQDEIKTYQQEVREHFTETAGLLRGLAENYRNVHNHLAQGADKLCAEEPSGPLIKKLPEVETIEVNEVPESVSAPLDYVPKATPFDKGILNEDYDLEKVKLSEAVSSEEVAELVANATSKQ